MPPLQMSDFKAKMHQNRFRLGIDPHQTPLGRGAYSAPPDLAGLKGPTSKGRGGDMGREGKRRKGKTREGRELRDRREGRAPQYFVAPPVPVF